jgi:hypothetical protein
MLEQLRVKLQTQRIGVLIDNLEPALINGEFIEPHQSYYVELLTVLAHPTVQSITLVTSREPLYEPGIMGFQTFQTYLLEGLTKKAWEKYFNSQNISININALSEMHRAYGGNALAMALLSSDIRKQYQGNLDVYWQENRQDLLFNRTLENLIERQFDKLQQDAPQTYKLLCRAGCYRYHYIPVVSQEGLFCLLWDERKESHKRQIVRDLRDRILGIFCDEEYYLHPIIQAEAMKRLRLNGEWKAANREAANFWKTTVLKLFNNKQIFLNSAEKLTQVENAEELLVKLKYAIQPFENWEDSQWRVIAFEAIYHFLEFTNLDFLEIMEQADTLEDPVTHLFVKDACEIVEGLIQLGISVYKLAEATHLLGIIDEEMGDVEQSKEELEESKIWFQKSWIIFQDALLIANQIKADSLAKKAQRALAGSYYYRAIGLHQLGLSLLKLIKLQESRKALQESKSNFEEAILIFEQIKAHKQAEEVKQAQESLAKSEKCCNISVALCFLDRQAALKCMFNFQAYF